MLPAQQEHSDSKNSEKKQAGPDMESLTDCQANRARVALVRRDTTEPDME